MKTRRRGIAVGMSLVVGVLVALPAAAREKKISRQDLPAAVLAAFEKAYPKAEIKGQSSEREHGTTYFEIESVEGAQSRDVLYLADGTVVEVEESVAAAELPAPVTAAVTAKYPHAQIVKGERTMRGSTVTYEVQITSDKHKRELEIGGDGKVIEDEKAGGRDAGD